MSNYLAVATVTEALRIFIDRRLGEATDLSLPVQVSAQRPPTDRPASALVTVFCYHIAPNPQLRNFDAPTRAADGTLLTKPQAAYDLHYLISFYGDDQTLDAQRMLGIVVRSLYEEPTLQAADIQAAAAETFLAGSDLAASPQRVRFTPTHMDLDDLYKLWTMMAQTQMALSLTYQATMVFLDGTQTPAAGKPVLTRTVRALTGGRPTIERLLAQGPGDAAPVEGPVGPADDLVIQGSGLAAATVWLRIAGTDLRADPAAAGTKISDTQIQMPLPATLPPGVYPVQVLQDVAAGAATTLVKVAESNVMAFVRRPGISGQVSVTAGTIPTLSIPLEIPVRSSQRVQVLLDELAPAAGQPARSYQFTAPFPVSDQPTVTALDVQVPGVAPAAYLVRIQVDGAQSALATGPDGFTGPVADLSGGGG